MYIFFRSCVDESLPLCMGTPYCASKGDLKWCKNTTLWGQADTKLKPLLNKAFCKSSGQQIAAMDMQDGKVYNCLNRGDETPYKPSENRTSNETDNSKKKTWLEREGLKAFLSLSFPPLSSFKIVILKPFLEF